MKQQHWIRWAGCVVAAAVAAPSASAQWSDNFDSYTAGSVINGQGGWQQWDNLPNTTSVVSTAFARSAPNSVGIFSTAAGTSDLVQRFSGYTSGKWSLKTYVYVPGPNSSAPLVDTIYFLVLNTYNDLGPYDWSVDLELRGATGQWAAYPGSPTPNTGTLITDAWVEVRADIDLDNDLVEVFYNGQSVTGLYSWSGGWAGGNTGQVAIEALDLYHDPGSTPTSGGYWDDTSLEPQCGTVLNYCTAGTTTLGCTASIHGTGTPSATAGSGFTISVTTVEPQKQGILFYGINNTGFSPVAWGLGGTSFLCVKAPTQRMGVQNSGGTLGTCSGTLSTDWNAFIAANPALGTPFSAGDQVFAQGWFRDPPNIKTTSLSNGLSFVVCP